VFNKTLFIALLVTSLTTAFLCSPGEAIDDVVLYFSFDEIEGDAVKDLSPYGNDGTLVRSPKQVDGKVGKALTFDGSNFVEVPHDDSLNFTGAHTISYWLKWDGSGSSWSPFISKTGGSDQFDHYHTWVGSDQQWDYANGNKRVTSSVLVPLNDEWVFLTVTHDGKNTVSFYRDGVLDDTQELGTYEGNDAPFRVGDDGKGNLGVGTIDELALFKIALTEEEINTLMEEGADAFMAVEPSGKLSTIWGSMKNKF